MDKTTFVLTTNPPWYAEAQEHEQPFTCSYTEELFTAVAAAMSTKTTELLDYAGNNAYQPQTIRKLVRDMVIEDIGQFTQRPSRPLLIALMDIVDIQAIGLECMSTDDRAGIKELLLALTNYTHFYIPAKDLKVTSDSRVVIPVVTTRSQDSNAAMELRYCDQNRSSLATYLVNLKYATEAYFVQQVLVVPGVKSLALLRTVTGNKYHFWDMSLEVPTHLDALTPAFDHVPQYQLLHESPESTSTPNQQTEGDSTATINAMCCIYESEAVNVQGTKQPGSVDCLDVKCVKGDLSHFVCESGIVKVVYCRRNDKSQGQDDKIRCNLTPIVRKRRGQECMRTLFVSTTARFCRAIQCNVVKGSGVLLKHCHHTLQKLRRTKTFLSGPELHQDIIMPAVTAFVKRVVPATNYWCNYIPKHIVSSLEPIMGEILELGVKFMDNKIPNAFAIAELLLCPQSTFEKYAQAYEAYTSNETYRREVNAKNIQLLEKQQKEDWQCLLHANNSICNELPSWTNSMPDINVVTCTLNKYMKTGKTQSSSCTNTQRNILDTKVFLHNLRVYQNKISKLKKTSTVVPEENTKGDDATNTDELSTSPKKATATTAQKPSMLPKQTTTSHPTSKANGQYVMIVPDNPHVSTWIEHLGTILQSTAWLYSDIDRREVVCDILGLSKSLLPYEKDVLTQWVINNSVPVEQLKSHSLTDKLSLALIRRLEEASTESWLNNIHGYFKLKQSRLLAYARHHRNKSTVSNVARRNTHGLSQFDDADVYDSESAENQESCNELYCSGEYLGDTMEQDNIELSEEEEATMTDIEGIDSHPSDELTIAESSDQESKYIHTKCRRSRKCAQGTRGGHAYKRALASDDDEVGHRGYKRTRIPVVVTSDIEHDDGDDEDDSELILSGIKQGVSDERYDLDSNTDRKPTGKSAHSDGMSRSSKTRRERESQSRCRTSDSCSSSTSRWSRKTKKHKKHHRREFDSSSSRRERDKTTKNKERRDRREPENDLTPKKSGVYSDVKKKRRSASPCAERSTQGSKR